jgi:hypothetical protein
VELHWPFPNPYITLAFASQVEREAAMLAAVSARVEETLTFVFQHYKALAECEPTGVLEGINLASSLPAPALPLFRQVTPYNTGADPHPHLKLTRPI